MIINSNVENEIIIQKSRFITYLYRVKDKNEFELYYNILKKKYKDATHICYSYIIDNEIKFSDDKEPNGSAGIPILDVLKKNHLNYVACFVIRYFGGIKLGGAGLIRAYSNSTSLCLKKTSIKEPEKIFKLQVTLSYPEINTLENIIDAENILKKEFKDTITYIILVNKEKKELLNSFHFSYILLEESYF